MKTEILSTEQCSVAAVATKAKEVLSRGGLVAFPTETVYGLGGSALDETAARRIYEAKGRPSDNPLIVHVGYKAQVRPLVRKLTKNARLLMKLFWPGPLTLILKKAPVVPDATTGGLDTVALRMPSHPVARAVLKAAGVPVAAPSANRSGRPSTTSGTHVIEDLSGRVDLIIDGGEVPIGVESTILDLTGPVPVLLRPGAVTLETLRQVLGRVEVDPAIREENLITHAIEVDHPKAPGMKYRHYAPKAEMTIVSGPIEAVVRYVNARSDDSTGILTFDEHRTAFRQGKVLVIGSKDDPEAVAHRLFDALRAFDAMNVTRIFAEELDSSGIGNAVMNRLLKAAGGNYIRLSDETDQDKTGGTNMIAIGCDHGGYELKLEVEKELTKKGVAFKDFGCDSTASCDYPVYARKVVRAILSGEAEKGILICGTGIGISITANRYKGIRAALCTDCFMAEATRLHNDANILCMGGRVVGSGLAVKIVDTFLNTPFSGEERHERRIRMIEEE